MNYGDLVYMAIVGAVVCAIFAAEPVWMRLYRFLHRHDEIQHPLGKQRLGK